MMIVVVVIILMMMIRIILIVIVMERLNLKPRCGIDFMEVLDLEGVYLKGKKKKNNLRIQDIKFMDFTLVLDKKKYNNNDSHGVYKQRRIQGLN